MTPIHKTTAIKVMMMPKDTNPYGIIFGGVILSYIDQAGAIAALEYARNTTLDQNTFNNGTDINFVTVAMNEIEFHQPVYVGDTVSFNTTIIKNGESSVTVKIRVVADHNGKETIVTDAQATYVAIDLSNRKPIKIFRNE